MTTPHMVDLFCSAVLSASSKQLFFTRRVQHSILATPCHIVWYPSGLYCVHVWKLCVSLEQSMFDSSSSRGMIGMSHAKYSLRWEEQHISAHLLLP